MPTDNQALMPVLTCVAAAALVLIVAILDYSHSVAQVPPLPEPCPIYAHGEMPPPGTPDVCDNPGRNALVEARQDRSEELDQDFDRRLELYSLAIFAIGIAYLLLRLRTLPPDERRTAFTDLGIGAVAWLVAVIAIFWLQSSLDDPLEPAIGPPLAAGGGLVLIATLGSVVTWSRPPGGLGETASGLPLAVKVGAALMLGSLVASSIALSGSNRCEEARPEWIDTAFVIAIVLAGAAALCGAVALVQRRWFAALLLIAVAPFWALLAAIGAACLS